MTLTATAKPEKTTEKKDEKQTPMQRKRSELAKLADRLARATRGTKGWPDEIAEHIEEAGRSIFAALGNLGELPENFVPAKKNGNGTHVPMGSIVLLREKYAAKYAGILDTMTRYLVEFNNGTFVKLAGPNGHTAGIAAVRHVAIASKS